MSGVKPTTAAELSRYEKIYITGGEPLLFPDQLGSLVRLLRANNENQEIYLNTALPTEWLINNLDLFDGITVGIHSPYDKRDIDRLFHFQTAIRDRKESYRLFFDITLGDVVLPIIPDRWTKVEGGPMVGEGECPVPFGEDLLELRDAGSNASYEEYLKLTAGAVS